MRLDPNKLSLEIQRLPVTADELHGLASLLDIENEAHVVEALRRAADEIERLLRREDRVNALAEAVYRYCNGRADDAPVSVSEDRMEKALAAYLGEEGE